MNIRASSLQYKEALKFLYNLEPIGVKFGLERITSLLASIGCPHKKYKSILIAGTNGKGSTAAMTASIIGASGIRVGLYTSPHIENFRERIRINGIPISEEMVAYLTEKIRFRLQQNKAVKYITYFEFVTAIAFLYFALNKVDLAVLEVGMGGRLDATNVVTPIVSIITEIDYDHSFFLGEDILSIAREKGGIIKHNARVVLSSKKGQVVDLISEMCEKADASLSILGRDFYAEGIKKSETGQTIKVRIHEWILDSLELSMTGEHQIRNAATAVRTAMLLNQCGFTISEQDIKKGLSETRLEGRLELIHRNPRVILDIAHNPCAAASLAESLKENFDYRYLYLVIGIMKDKEIGKIIAVLASLAKVIFVTRPQTLRAALPELLEEEALRYSLNVKKVEDVSAAVSEAISLAGKKDLICVTGSCYTVGEARSLF